MANKLEQTLQSIGKNFAKVFNNIEKIAIIGEPFVDIVFPSIAPIYNAAAAGAAAAVNAAKSSVSSGNTDAQNLLSIATAVEPILQQYAQQAGLSAPTIAVLLKYASALQASLSAATKNS